MLWSRFSYSSVLCWKRNLFVKPFSVYEGNQLHVAMSKLKTGKFIQIEL